jgi:hypothetical protein
MSSFGHFLKRSAVVGVAFAATSAPSVAWAGTPAPPIHPASASIRSVGSPGWYVSSDTGGIYAWGFSVEGVGGCDFQLRNPVLYPVSGCSALGQSFYVVTSSSGPIALLINGQFIPIGLPTPLM